MTLLALIIGLGFPTLNGWLLLSVLEGQHRVLLPVERGALGCVLGASASMFLTFILHILGIIPFTAFGMLAAQVLLLIILTIILFRRPGKVASETKLAASGSISNGAMYVILFLGIWTAIKVISMGSVLVLSPPYHDDVVNNWNFRGKVFYETQQLTLALPMGFGIVQDKTVSSYPPTVPMLKTWMATIQGEWKDAVANSWHIVWYVCALILLFYGLRRHLNILWSVIGTYLLASIPLYLMHGSVAYADLFLSAHLFTALSMLLHMTGEKKAERQECYARISALAVGLLLFTKNEGLLLYAPPLALLVTAVVVKLTQQKELQKSTPTDILLWYGGIAGAVLIPWLLFKWFHHLPFGNAKPISGLSIGWQSGVLQSIWMSMFFDGSWLLLPALFLGLLYSERDRAFTSPLVILVSFTLAVIAFQMVIFLFTSLSVEVTKKTGYNRGIIHLLPTIVLITTVLLQNAVAKKK